MTRSLLGTHTLRSCSARPSVRPVKSHPIPTQPTTTGAKRPAQARLRETGPFAQSYWTYSPNLRSFTVGGEGIPLHFRGSTAHDLLERGPGPSHCTIAPMFRILWPASSTLINIKLGGDIKILQIFGDIVAKGIAGQSIVIPSSSSDDPEHPDILCVNRECFSG